MFEISWQLSAIYTYIHQLYSGDFMGIYIYIHTHYTHTHIYIYHIYIYTHYIYIYIYIYTLYTVYLYNMTNKKSRLAHTFLNKRFLWDPEALGPWNRGRDAYVSLQPGVGASWGALDGGWTGAQQLDGFFHGKSYGKSEKTLDDLGT